MRVIAGGRKGQRLKLPAGTRIRPTAGKVRQAVFNILPHDLSGSRALDLYAGSGALGIEALSRGARFAVMVDSGRESARLIRENLTATHFSDRARVMVKKAGAALKLLAAEGESFDLVFADPPYRGEEALRVLKMLGELELLSEEAVVVIEHAPTLELPENSGLLDRFDQRRYGSAAVSFYRKKDREP